MRYVNNKQLFDWRNSKQLEMLYCDEHDVGLQYKGMLKVTLMKLGS